MTLRPCIEPKCPGLTPKSRCPRHEAEYEAKRGTAAQRGYGAKHQAWRVKVLQNNRSCAHCGAHATVADHIVPLSEDGSWDVSNGQGLCIPCHNRKTRKEQNRRARLGVVIQTAPRKDDVDAARSDSMLILR